jgi:hypothetical protein
MGAKILRLIIFFPLIMAAQVKPVSNPYHFNGPDFNGLLPFSEEQMQLYRKAKVKSIFSEESSGINGMFYFNEAGQLYKERTWIWQKNKKVFTDSTVYTYNNRGQVMVSHSFGANESYDSISYDANGRISGFLSWEITNLKNKKQKTLLWDVRYVKDEGDNKLLEDKADTSSKVMMMLDKDNSVIKSWSAYRKDSTYLYAHMGDPPLNLIKNVKQYFSENNGKYNIGREFTYTDNLLRSDILYETERPGVIARRQDYVYSDDRKLLQVNESYSSQLKTVFIYNLQGLVSEEVSILPDQVEITFFTYQFY